MNQLIATGLVAGVGLASIYILVSLSLTLVLTASGVFNFAQSSIVMGATIASFYLTVSLHMPAIAVVALTVVGGGAAGAVTHFLAVAPALDRAANFTEATLLTTFGLGTAVNAFAALLFGSEPRSVPSYVPNAPIIIASVPVRPIYAVMVGVAAIVVIATELVMRRTEVGLVFRITLEDRAGAELAGIRTKRVVIVAFIIAGAISGVAGFLVAPAIAASAYTAQQFAFYGFAAIAIGGFGSFAGTLVGGMIVGLVGGLVPTVLTTVYVNPILYGLILVVLIVKPTGLWGAAGLFGSAKAREV